MVAKSWYDPLLAKLARAHAQRQLNYFMSAAHSAVETQQKTLLRKIRVNTDSDYGRKHDFRRIRTYDDFIRRVPVQTYEDLQPYVERVMKGETRALFGPGQRVLMFAMTSGSTDAPKYVPVTSAFVQEYRRGWNAFGLKAILDHPGALLRSIVQVTSPMDEECTPSGVPCGSISGLLARSQKRLVRKYYVTPQATGRIADPDARYYTIMRFAVPADVGWMVTASPATQLKLARTAAAHAEGLIRDIHDGTLNPPGTGESDLFAALRQRLNPDRRSARRLETVLAQHGELLPKHYWNLAFLANWTGGSMGLYLQDFPHYFGDTPIRDIGLLATEGRTSICVEDGTPIGPLDVAGSFFEFMDADADENDASAVHLCHEVIPGKEYRVIMTTSAGFYRYDIGDHVRVHGFIGKAPLIEFLHRGAHSSSITGEKLTEWQVTAAFDRARQALGVSADNFVLASYWGDPPFYVLHMDRSEDHPSRLASRMDEELAGINLEYASKRKSQRLGMIVPNRLPPGTLAERDAQLARRRGPANEQFKHRFLLTHPDDGDLGGPPSEPSPANLRSVQVGPVAAQRDSQVIVRLGGSSAGR